MNTFELRLNEKPFNSIKNGTKKIEMRLLDEKRQQYQIGDVLIFKKRPEEIETIKTKIINLHKVASFKDLYEMFDKSILGYEKDEQAHFSDMEEFYPVDEQKLYGVVGIEIELI